MSTLHLTTAGLYVNVPWFIYSFPATIPELERDVPNLLSDLLTFRYYVFHTNEQLAKSSRSKVELRGALGNINSQGISEKQFWKRPTYYTRPRETTSCVPSTLYGLSPPSDLKSKLLKASFPVNSGDNTNTYNDVCEYGWRKTGDKYYNLYSKVYSDTHLCCAIP